MENSHLQLLAELPGLETAQRAIAARINEIRLALGMAIESPQPGVVPAPALGVDTLGRRISPRVLSPEVKENRRRLIALARQKKLDKLSELKAAAAGAAVVAPEPPTPPSPLVKKGKARG